MNADDRSSRAGLLMNSRSRHADQAQASIIEALRASGLHLVQALRVTHPKKLAKAAESLLDQGIGRLIVGGGDGSISTVAPLVAARSVRLGVLPLGTANDFARTLNIPADLDAAAQVAAGDHVEPVDLARANDVVFLNVASIGMSVEAMHKLSPGMKRALGPIAYVVAGARAFFGHQLFKFRMKGWDDQQGSAHQVVVANGRFYGGGVLVAQDSTLDDGKLTAYCLGCRGRWELLRTIALQKMQFQIERPGDAYVRATTLRVETWPSLPVNLDGEIRTRTPVEFSVEEKALSVLVPPPTD